jgi:hypothetical protein
LGGVIAQRTTEHHHAVRQRLVGDVFAPPDHLEEFLPPHHVREAASEGHEQLEGPGRQRNGFPSAPDFGRLDVQVDVLEGIVLGRLRKRRHDRLRKPLQIEVRPRCPLAP